MKKTTLVLLTILVLFLFSASQLNADITPILHKTNRTSPRSNTVSGTLTICALRVDFQTDNTAATTGNGKFLRSSVELPCQDADFPAIDPAPHNNAYFKDHIKSLSNYFRHASSGQLIIDTLNSAVFPLDDDSVYTLPRQMSYYHPFLKADSIDVRLTQLLVEAIERADQDNDIDFSQYDVVVVFHAGVGQDFAIDLDPTPYDIPSAFLNSDDIADYYTSIGQSGSGVTVDGGLSISEGILLPESQNHLLYENWEDVFGGAATPCDYQIGLNGTFAFMMGFYLGLPGLYNTETGETGVGKFGLMDQGSANLNGLVPSYPSAWERTFMGWETPVTAGGSHDVHLDYAESGSDTSIWMIPINDDEYFLLENRYSHVRPGVYLDSIQYKQYVDNDENEWPPLIPLIVDSIGAEFSNETGVFLSLPRYDVGLPGSGLLIWHIDERVIDANLAANSINNDREHYGVDLEEGDGAQDLGYQSNIIGASVDIGWYFDPWFAGNDGFWDLNADYPQDDEKRVGFSNATNPSSRSNRQAYTGIVVDSIGPSQTVMNFRISRSHQIYTDENLRSSFPVLNIDLDADDGSTEFVAIDDDSIYLYLPNTIKLSSAELIGFKPMDMIAISSNRFAFSNSAGNDTSRRLFQVWQIAESYDMTLIDTFMIEMHEPVSNIIAYDGILLQAVKTVDQQTRLVSYAYAARQLEYHDLNQGNYKIIGAAEGIFLINCSSGSMARVELSTAGIQTIDPLLTSATPEVINAVVGFIDVNTTPDVVVTGHHKIELFLNPGSDQSEIKSFDINGDYGDHLALSDIDGDNRLEIIVQTDAKIYVFNEALILENNFPFSVPNQFSGDIFTGQLLTNDMDGDGILDIVTFLENNGVTTVSYSGDLIDGFPLSIKRLQEGSASLVLLDGNLVINGETTEAPQSFFGVQFDNMPLSENAWYVDGGNRQRNYSPSFIPSVSAPDNTGLLNKRKTFNWPNPTRNDRTAIRYYPTADCNIDITIYDLAGNFIKSFSDSSPLINDFNEIEWDTRNIANGVYLAVVSASSGSQTESKIIKIMVVH